MRRENWNLEMLVFEEGGKPENPENSGVKTDIELMTFPIISA